MSHTQKDRILQYMVDFGSITPMEAFHEIGCTKLATRISELIRDGTEISKETVWDRNRWGQKVHYTKYRLVV